MKVTIGNMRAAAVGFGDGQTVTGVMYETSEDGGDAGRPERPARADRTEGATIVADSVEFGGPDGPTIRGQR